MNKNLSKMTKVLLVGATLFSAPVFAEMTVGGVKFGDSIEIDGMGLALNGAGVRHKLFLEVYAAGMYLPEATSNQQVALSVRPALIRLVITSKLVNQARIAEAIDEGLTSGIGKDNIDAQTANDIQTLRGLFPSSISKGSVLDFYVGADESLTIRLDGQELGRFSNPKMGLGTLRSWIGDNPVEAKLKSGLLGN
ncbi:MAG: chalcone isomerase family protein [Gammaproteobacteria bacterium]|nr:chalcone isomerase family protein [Gammaproteobacteria bacterium]